MISSHSNHFDTIMQEQVNEMYQSLQRKIDRLMQLQAELTEAKMEIQRNEEGGDDQGNEED
jgi:hypothetical protein